MKPILYGETERAFTNNGIGVLSDAVSCVSKTVLNGRCDISLQYPISGIHADGLKPRNILLVRADSFKEPQPYRIKRVLKISNDLISVQANHMAYDLDGVAVLPFTAETAPAALESLSVNAVNECPFSLETDKTTEAVFSVATPSTIWPLLGGSRGSILDVYGGEYDFDRFTVKLLNRRGADRGVVIRYGKNLSTLEQDENCANCYTGVIPYYVDAKTGAVKMLPNKAVMVDGVFSYSRLLPVDMTSKFEEVPTDEQLTSAAKNYIASNNIGKPDIGWKVEFVPLEKTDEYRDLALLEQITLGDTVHVYFPKMNISASARAVETEFDCILERYNYIYLGSVKASLADTIAGQSQQLAQLPTESQMQQEINKLASTIMGATGGSVRFLDNNGDGMPDTLYIADDPDPAIAKKVWRFNYQGWAASSNGYNGPFTMGATFDSGILADFIRAGTLDASIVKVINLIAEVVNSINAHGDYVTIQNGEICGGSVDPFVENFSLKRDGSGVFALTFFNDHENLGFVHGKYQWDMIELGAVEQSDPAFRLEAYRARLDTPGFVKMQLPAESCPSEELYVYWHNNGDGTWSLLGTKDWQA